MKMTGLEDSIGYLVHFPSLVRICRENKLKMLDIGNFVSYYEERRKHYSEHLHKLGVLSKQFPTLANEQKSVVQLYTTFVFQKELWIYVAEKRKGKKKIFFYHLFSFFSEFIINPRKKKTTIIESKFTNICFFLV